VVRRFTAVRIERPESEAFQSALTVKTRDLHTFMHQNVWCCMNATDKVIGHVLTQTPAHQQVYGASPATFREKHRCLTGGVPCPHDGDILIVIKPGFHAGACVMDASRFKSLRTFDVELPPAHACRCQNRAGVKLRTAIEVERMETIRTACGIDSVDNDPAAQGVAQRHLGHDPRVSFHLADGAEFLRKPPSPAFDLIYADTWAGKFSDLDVALGLVRVGGFYVVDDLLPQPNWPDGHALKIPVLINELESRGDFATVKLAWASGLLVLARTHIQRSTHVNPQSSTYI